MKKLTTSLIVLLLSLLMGCGCTSTSTQKNEPPAVSVVGWKPTVAPERDSTGYYTEGGMISFIRPEETRDLVKAFEKDRSGARLDWNEPVTYVAIADWLSRQHGFHYQSDLDKLVETRPDGTEVVLHTQPGDHWKTPAETIRDNGGDCEDFSILMLSFLREAGCVKNLRIVLGRVEGHEGPGLHLWVSVSLRKGQESREIVIDSFPYKVYYRDDDGLIIGEGKLYRGTILRVAEIPLGGVCR